MRGISWLPANRLAYQDGLLREVSKEQFLEKGLERPRLQYLKHVAKNTVTNSYKHNEKMDANR